MAYDDIQDQIDQGRQQAADELGPPYDVFRMTNQDVSGNVLIAGNKLSTVNVFEKIAYGGKVRTDLETEKQAGIMWCDIVADMSPFKVGDVFVLNDPVYGQGASSVNFATNEFKGFALADHSPIKKSLGGRLNCTVTIFRPSASGNSNNQWDISQQNAQPVVLSSGVFSLGSTGATAVKIPAGLIALPRSPRWELYLPALNGFNGKEGDHIVGPDGAKYVLVIPYTQKVGTSGSQWFIDREAPGP